MTQVTGISVTFSRGSFQEWCEAGGDTYPQAFVEEWETNYNRIITERLNDAFPRAKIEVSEGYDQTMYPNIDISFGINGEDDWLAEDRIKKGVEDLLDIVNAADQIWTTPNVEAISNAIDGATDERPIAKISYNGANFVFAKHDGATYWMDLDIDDPFNPDDEWLIGTLEDAAIVFRGAFQ